MVLRGVVRVCFPFFFPLFFRLVPSSLHARSTTLHRHLSRFCSVLMSSPSAILWVAPGGPRPCRATQPFSPRCCTCISSPPSLPSPPLCLLPALLVLFPCSVCLPLVASAPRLYLARPLVPQGLRPVFRPLSAGPTPLGSALSPLRMACQTKGHGRNSHAYPGGRGVQTLEHTDTAGTRVQMGLRAIGRLIGRSASRSGLNTASVRVKTRGGSTASGRFSDLRVCLLRVGQCVYCLCVF